jgi:hypothetical protein
MSPNVVFHYGDFITSALPPFEQVTKLTRQRVCHPLRLIDGLSSRSHADVRNPHAVTTFEADNTPLQQDLATVYLCSFGLHR